MGLSPVAAPTQRPTRRHAATEAPPTLVEAPPRALGLADQLGLWGSLGVSLLLPVTATFLAPPGQSLLATLTAIGVGTLLGCALLGLGALAGARTGAPSMVLLRGLLGRRGSYLPTALNLLQCVGWSTFEVVVIAAAAHRVWDGPPRWAYVLVAGVVATSMALRPLGSVRVLRRYALWLVIASTAYLLVEVLRQPLGPVTDGSWTGFWTSVDLVVALPVSWIPLAADYSRHARGERDAFVGAFAGYAVASAAFFALGVLALRAYALEPGNDVIDSLLAVPIGAVALLVLVVDEVDEAFANIYSTAVSVQNVGPRLDRRVLAAVVGTIAVALALAVDVADYEAFLFLIGAVFVPLSAVLFVDFFLLRGRRAWDVGAAAPERLVMLVPWLAGFVAYQLTAPTAIDKWPAWAQRWTAWHDSLGLPDGWSGSLVAFTVAAALALVVGRTSRTGRGGRVGGGSGLGPRGAGR